jgi:hypothetical protein
MLRVSAQKCWMSGDCEFRGKFLAVRVSGQFFVQLLISIGIDGLVQNLHSLEIHRTSSNTSFRVHKLEEEVLHRL